MDLGFRRNFNFPTIFLHFFDIHFLDQKGIISPHNIIVQECRLATRLAIAIADKVIVPAASFFESSICQNIILEHKDLLPLGVIEITGNANHLPHFREKKLTEYNKESGQFEVYSKLDADSLTPPFITRKRSATHDIAAHWLDTLEKYNPISLISQKVSGIPSNFERRWAAVPEQLEDQAFIVKNVQTILGGTSRHPNIEHHLHTIINRGYFESYTLDFNAGVITNMVYLDAGYEIETHDQNLPYRQLLISLKLHGLLQTLESCPPMRLLEFRAEPQWIAAIQNGLQSSLRDKISKSKKSRRSLISGGIKMQDITTFIVHGHNNALLFELKDYLQNTLELPEPIILSQQPSSGRTIIEKFEEVVEKVDIALRNVSMI